MKRQKLPSNFTLFILLGSVIVTFLSNVVSPSCEIVDSELVRDPDICFQSCKKHEAGKELCKLLKLSDDCNEASRTVCEWKCTPAPKRYVEVRTCCPGYKNSTITGQCEELNECEGDDDGKLPPCEGTCVNTPGSFKCSCPDGFHLAPDGYKCQDNDECTLNASLCLHGKCVNSNGSFECICPTGRHLSKNRTICADVDECDIGVYHCGQTCVNTEGSYHCACLPGFHLLDDGITCEDIDECKVTEKPLCSGGTCTNTNGSYTCQCPTGYRRTSDGSNCIDIDECEENSAKCFADVGKCFNIPGSFYCSCKSGFTLSDDGFTCNDNNECLDGTANCAYMCENTYGSYTCKTCQPGYRFQNQTCLDIDECRDGTAECQEICINTPGSYRCSCQRGFELTPNQLNCQDIDECEVAAFSCSHFCENTNGSYICSCPDYMMLFPGDNSTCQYIRYADFFNAGTNRILASVFISLISILALCILVHVVYRQCHRHGDKGICRFFKSGRKLKKHERAFGYHLAVPPIDEDIKHAAPENSKLII